MNRAMEGAWIMSFIIAFYSSALLGITNPTIFGIKVFLFLSTNAFLALTFASALMVLIYISIFLSYKFLFALEDRKAFSEKVMEK